MNGNQLEEEKKKEKKGTKNKTKQKQKQCIKKSVHVPPPKWKKLEEKEERSSYEEFC